LQCHKSRNVYINSLNLSLAGKSHNCVNGQALCLHFSGKINNRFSSRTLNVHRSDTALEDFDISLFGMYVNDIKITHKNSFFIGMYLNVLKTLSAFRQCILLERGISSNRGVNDTGCTTSNYFYCSAFLLHCNLCQGTISEF